VISLLLDVLVLQPLSAIYGVILSWLPDALGAGGKLISFGILLNVALMPVYRQMELRSRKGRAVKERVAREVARMKAHFRGRERYFYIRAVHRQFGYHPIHEVLGSADLLVQVIVFSTVYRFLSGHPALVGTSFGPIRDLSRPDTLLAGIHLLPLLMTLINVGAVLAYVDGWRLRLPGIALAALFLWLLYGSAAGLVLYWTSNNVFSLVRNLIQRVLSARLADWGRAPLEIVGAQR
jgi:membrane protein insertase Oxa1/YidC/SpoIIIJ